MIEKPRAVLKKPFMSTPLSPDEAALSKSFTEENWEEVTDKQEREKAIGAARTSKSERTNIRLPEADLLGLKAKADQKGIGYQTLIASIIHQYVSDNLLEINVATEKLMGIFAKKVAASEKIRSPVMGKISSSDKKKKAYKAHGMAARKSKRSSSAKTG